VRLTLEASPPDADGTVRVRLLALNDDSVVARLDRRLLVGPNPVGAELRPVSLEPRAAREDENIVVLNPWCLYGRERQFSVAAGQLTFHAYLLAHADERLLPQGPADPSALALAADPLIVQPS
jgi:hypothetical protein